MSNRIKLFILPLNSTANALDNSVFPTPVGPTNRNEPIGLLGSLIPDLERLIALLTAVTAPSCPITLLFSASANPLSFSVELASSSVISTPDIFDIVSRISLTPIVNTLSSLILALRRAPVSSRTVIALSGNLLLVIYLSESLTVYSMTLSSTIAL